MNMYKQDGRFVCERCVNRGLISWKEELQDVYDDDIVMNGGPIECSECESEEVDLPPRVAIKMLMELLNQWMQRIVT